MCPIYLKKILRNSQHYIIFRLQLSLAPQGYRQTYILYKQNVDREERLVIAMIVSTINMYNIAVKNNRKQNRHA